jgi:nicotinamide-nucleotide amidase
VTSPKIELLNTGSELLLGSVRDLHLSWFGKELFPLGLRISRQTTVPDGSAIRDAVLESFSRADVLIITGGLGPTTDDITRELVTELLGLRLQLHQETLHRIQERCHRRGFTFQSRMQRQAMVPEGATVFPNEHGTAPGLHIPQIKGVSWATPHLILLPGPPRELQPMAKTYVLPLLSQLFADTGQDECRTYRVVGMGESMLEAEIGLSLSQRRDLEVGYCARINEVDFRLIGKPAVLDEVEPLVLEKIGDHLISQNNDTLEAVLIDLLQQSKSSITTAESCTGGLLASRLTDVPGASEVFLEGFVTYSNKAKIELLGVSSNLISRHGAVSSEVAEAMAQGALAKSGATYALAITGIAGPGGGSQEKPAGTVFLALAEKGQAPLVWKEYFPIADGADHISKRATFKQLTTQSALNQLRKRILSKPS